MSKSKLILSILLTGILVLLGFLLYRYSNNKTGSDTREIKNITMVTDIGQLGDQSFNDAGWKGVQMASKGLNLEAEVIQTKKKANLDQNVTKAAQNSDVVVGLGFMIKDSIKKAAKKYPETYFILIDENAGNLNNVASYNFYSGQSGYLAGIIAASCTKTNKLGLVKGMEVPSILSYTAGFRAGVKTWNKASGEGVKVISKTAETFTDSNLGAELTHELIDQNADIIFDIAGGTGVGVYRAVQERNRNRGVTIKEAETGTQRPPYFAVGVDVNHDQMYPGEVLVSALKRIPTTIYKATEEITKGKFKGGLHKVGFKQGATGISDIEYTKQYVPNQALSMIKQARKIMSEGGLMIPIQMDEVNEYIKNFSPPKPIIQAYQ